MMVLINVEKKANGEKFAKEFKKIMGLLGAYYVTTIEGAKIYKYVENEAAVEISMDISQEENITRIRISIEGDDHLIKKVDEFLQKYGIRGEKIAKPGLTEADKLRLKEIKREDVITKDEHMPFVLPGLYNYYKDPYLPSLLTLNIVNVGNEEKILRVEAEIIGYSRKKVKTFNLGVGEEKTLKMSPPLCKMDVEEHVKASLRYGIFEDNRTIEEQTYDITVYSPYDFMLGYEANGKIIHFYHFLAAWVTPNAACVNDIIDKAKQIKKNLCGDASMGVSNTDDDVMLQVKAVYMAMKEMGIEYINTPVSFAPGYSQRIRYAKNVIESKGGNCIEMTIVLASVLEKLNIAPIIIIVPCHAFLGFRLPSSEECVYLESTLIPTEEFEYALRVGRDEYNNYREEVYEIDIKKMRERNILPNEIKDV